ncbi:nucleotide exchange factor GrpE [Buchnera aphidicola (Ceratoglyphina bambusae)]|uniref:nucleotide exchange factor GrpE n=1 Tax=Buchnera aphidicola TaxID=9 RepID=UPI0031B8657F
MKKCSQNVLKNETKILKLKNKKVLSEYKNILKKINKKKKKISKLKKISKDNLKKFSKRMNKEINKSYKYSLEEIIIEVINIIDSFEKAVELKKNVKNETIKIVLFELENILKFFKKILKDCKVNEINKLNIKFNPNFHQAISIENLKEIPNNFIVKIVQKGYFLYDRLLRPAIVTVNKK